eukprot:355292-Chlamydomonas_euryale.AAC.9
MVLCAITEVLWQEALKVHASRKAHEPVTLTHCVCVWGGGNWSGWVLASARAHAAAAPVSSIALKALLRSSPCQIDQFVHGKTFRLERLSFRRE